MNRSNNLNSMNLQRIRKMIIFSWFFLFLILLSACQPSEFSEEMRVFLESNIPLQINDSFDLPHHEDASFVFEYQGQIINDIFQYEAPFFDQQITIEVTIKKGNASEKITMNRTLVAPDSALNVSQLYLTAPNETFDIPRDENMPILFHLQKNVNGKMHTIIMSDEVKIRGRGNSTWAMPKKPYRIRFDEAVSILGLPKTRTYVLLAEYADKSLLRNTIVHKFSSLLDGLEHTLSTRVVELYINDQYQGIYTLTEQIELSEEKISFDAFPGILDTGYFMELDQRFFEKGGIEGVNGFVVAGYPYEIIDPDPEETQYILEQTAWIKSYFESLEAALIFKKGYEAYIDVDNWIDYFIIQELFKNVDIGYSSVYIYKRPGDVVRLGPLWDFDLSTGNADYIDYHPENWYGMRAYKNRWFQLMMDIPEIREAFKIRYMEIYESIFPSFMAEIDTLFDAMIPLAKRNFERWDILGMYVWPNPPAMLEQDNYEYQLNYVKQFMMKRAHWMYVEVQTSRFLEGRFDS